MATNMWSRKTLGSFLGIPKIGELLQHIFSIGVNYGKQLHRLPVVVIQILIYLCRHIYAIGIRSKKLEEEHDDSVKIVEPMNKIMRALNGAQLMDLAAYPETIMYQLLSGNARVAGLDFWQIFVDNIDKLEQTDTINDYTPELILDLNGIGLNFHALDVVVCLLACSNVLIFLVNVDVGCNVSAN